VDVYKKPKVEAMPIIENKPDNVKESISTFIPTPVEELPSTIDEYICHVCKRKFPNADKLKLHEDLSALHKVTISLTQGKPTKIK
jgi:hypothetical protein